MAWAVLGHLGHLWGVLMSRPEGWESRVAWRVGAREAKIETYPMAVRLHPRLQSRRPWWGGRPSHCTDPFWDTPRPEGPKALGKGDARSTSRFP